MIEVLRESRERLEAVCLSQARAMSLGDGHILAKVLGSAMFYLDATDTGLTPNLALYGYWESWISLAVARRVRPGWHAVDVGANQGYYTVLLGWGAGPTGRVVAVEPNPRLQPFLQKTISANYLTNVEILPMAVTDAPGGTVRLNAPADRPMNGHIFSDQGVEVQTTSIDAITADWPRLDFVKIDVEGAEYYVWKGMRNTLKRFPGLIVLMEFNNQRFPNPGDLLDEIAEAGLRLAQVNGQGEVEPLDRRQLLEREGEWMLWLEAPPRV